MPDPVPAVAPVATDTPAAPAADASALAANAPAAPAVTPAATPEPQSAKAPDAAAAKPAEGDKSLLAGANDEAKKDGDKPAEAKPGESPAEPAYAQELVRPDGVQWSDEAWKSVAPVLAKHNVSKEAAQDLVNAYAAQVSAQQAAEHKKLVEIRSEGRAQCVREFKKEDFQSARRAIERTFSDPHLVQFFIDHLGDHPDFIRGMAKFGRAIADDSTPGATNSGGGSAPARLADMLYGKK